MPYVVDRIVAQGPQANLGRVFVPTGTYVPPHRTKRTHAHAHAQSSLTPHTGFQSKELIIKAGLVLGDVDQYPKLDVTIDGADE